MSVPVIFIHGLWLHGSSWQPWIDLFTERGYRATAPGWPGDADTVEASRANPDAIAGHGIDDVVEHYARIIEGLDARPILIGHSFGGMIAQKLLGLDLGAAAVAIDAAQIKGVLPLPLSTLRSGFPVLGNPANRNKAVSLTPEQFRYAFGNAVTEQESRELFDRWSIPAPGKPLFEAAAANFNPHSPAKVDTANESRGPLLLIAGGKDHTVPEVVVRATLKQYRHSHAVTDIVDFPDKAHSLTIDAGWRDVAETALTWLKEQGL
ncbi:alpha/beta hydrolase [Actinoplanes philippinensis]|uniref:Lysophospholipase, alpha-beta hydrolase superfamily n=1 Tax=Actinoplanes philippinensis TaxID=35752 RepID=A0A1I2GFT9_9ACTN|nr:alpha/beta fold hydrolase [Actinoplanes philippinensis]GIE76891.1 alpha/beta hydrolase [Actinoplanes philippinensis]SFF15949.1 Lysophospholipase, alpha-beta hydrolase superfamily [Actinoplanes philippinensis]